MSIRQQRRRRAAATVLFAASTLLLWAAPAGAQVPTTLPGLPLPTEVFADPPGAETGGSTPPTTTTPTTVPPTPPSTGAPAPTGAETTRRAPTTRPRATTPTTVAVVQPAVAAGEVDDEALSLPEDGGAVPTARRFSVPLALAALVSLFVAVQGRLDRRDPKLAVAPISMADDLLPFA